MLYKCMHIDLFKKGKGVECSKFEGANPATPTKEKDARTALFFF